MFRYQKRGMHCGGGLFASEDSISRHIQHLPKPEHTGGGDWWRKCDILALPPERLHRSFWNSGAHGSLHLLMCPVNVGGCKSAHWRSLVLHIPRTYCCLPPTELNSAKPLIPRKTASIKSAEHATTVVKSHNSHCKTSNITLWPQMPALPRPHNSQRTKITNNPTN